MGVQGLWELLAPVGRRVSVEALGSRRLAIDASIWIIQFMKAMRDDRGDMIRNAHLLGFFRRICKLLFLRIKPVFVFDGGTPALKRRTVIARRRQREQAQSKIRKTAERLLLNHLRTRKLEEIALGVGSLPPQKQPSGRGKKGKKAVDSQKENNDAGRWEPQSVPQGAAAGGVHGPESAVALLGGPMAGELEVDDEVAVVSSKSQRKSDIATGREQSTEKQELFPVQEEEEDEADEELIYLPAAQSKLDPAVLASLPPSMQLDLLVQMREQLVAENRQKFEKVAKAPSSFSQLQIEAYLKTVAFRREINNVQKAAAGRGVGGLPSARIASEVNREFIFSSSYQGDKSALTGFNGGHPMTAPKLPEPVAQSPSNPVSSLLSATYRSFQSGNRTKDMASEETDSKPDGSVHKYVDERGRTRVSRIRGMGVRMTRDLQWNLYLMKDVEKRQAVTEANEDDMMTAAEGLVNNGDGELFQRLMLGDQGRVSEAQPAIVMDGQISGGLQISFDETTLAAVESDDGDLFEGLVAGEGSFKDNVRSDKKLPTGADHRKATLGGRPAGSLEQSGLQISFEDGEQVKDEDLDLFKIIAEGEDEDSVERLEESKKDPRLTKHLEEEEDCEWEVGNTQGKEDLNIVGEAQRNVSDLAARKLSLSGPNENEEMSLAVQQSLQEHKNLNTVGGRRMSPTELVGEDSPSLPGNADPEMAAQMALAIQQSLERNKKSDKILDLQPYVDYQPAKKFSLAGDSDAEMALAIQQSLQESAKSNRVETPQPRAVNSFSLTGDTDAEMALAIQRSLQENTNRLSELQPHLATETGKNFTLAGDSDAEMAMAIQQSLSEHDKTQALQPGGYVESEDTGLSDDSDSGNSDESEVEWEDGSGAVAVAGAGFTVAEPGLLLTAEEAELQEAIRRSLDDVGSWRAPARAGLPQLVIREPLEDIATKGPVTSPEVASGELELTAGIGNIVDMDSEEARLARERARKGKAVAGESVISPAVAVESAASQLGSQQDGCLLEENMKGKTTLKSAARVEVKELGRQPLGTLDVDAQSVLSSGARVGVSPPRQESLTSRVVAQKEGKENWASRTEVIGQVPFAYGNKIGGQTPTDIQNQVVVPYVNGVSRDGQAVINADDRVEGPYSNWIIRSEGAGINYEKTVVPHTNGVGHVQIKVRPETISPIFVDQRDKSSVPVTAGQEEPALSRTDIGISRNAERHPQILDQNIEGRKDDGLHIGSVEFDVLTRGFVDPANTLIVEGEKVLSTFHNKGIEPEGYVNVVDGTGLTNKPDARHLGHSPPTTDITEEMLRDAEEMDLAQEREEMLKHEEKLLAEREALAREEAELQAELEEEQDELRAGIEKERELLFQEEAELRDVQKKNERNADSVTGEMFAECQELLQMFGLPYIIAPMEAEAQCAYMDTMQLVDGVVTDDCDVFLFGGRNVYKNIFDDRKYVETYYMKDVETEMGLTREKLIRMALLLGSDYTEGISGIGIVNAIEVVNAFSEEDGLRKFKVMVESPDLTLLGLQGKGSRKKGGRGKEKGEEEKDMEGLGIEKGEENVAGDDVDGLTEIGDEIEEPESKLRQQVFMENHRAVSKNWNIPESFPSYAVVEAYKNPRVDMSTDPFTWGRPDLEALRKFCNERFGWPKDKADDLLLPVLKEYDRRETQLRMDAFYTFNQRFAKVRSARIQKALRGTAGSQLASELVDIPEKEGSLPVKKPRKRKGKQVDSPDTNTSEVLMEDVSEPGSGLEKGRRSGRGKFRQTKDVGTSMNEKALEGSNIVETPGIDDAIVSQGQGRGRGRGRGRGQGRGRGKGIGRSKAVPYESSSSQSGSEGAADVVLEKGGSLKRKADGQLPQPGRSGRSRTQTNYNLPEDSDDCATGSERRDDGIPSNDHHLKLAGWKSRESAGPTSVTASTTSEFLSPKQVKKDMQEIHDTSWDGAQPGSPTPDFVGAGGGCCNSDEHMGGGFVRSDEEGAAADTGCLQPPDYMFNGGGFCVLDKEDDSLPSKDPHKEDESQTRASDLNMASRGHIDRSQNPAPLAIPGLNVNEEKDLRSEFESGLADSRQVSADTGVSMISGKEEASVGGGLRAMPLLRRKRPANKP